MAQWPSTLPPPVVEGYTLEPLDQTIRTEMEVGAPRVRRRTRARVDRARLRWVLTDAEMAVFRDWFQDDGQSAGGAAWFAVDLPVGLGGISPVEARVVEWQGALRRGLRWEVSAQVEVRVRSPAELEGAARGSAAASGTL